MAQNSLNVTVVMVRIVVFRMMDEIQFYNNDNDDDDRETKLSLNEHLSNKCRRKTIFK